MRQAQKLGSDDPPVRLRRLVVRLRMITVNLGDAGPQNVLGEQLSPADDGKADVFESPLVAPAGGVADDDGKNIDGEMIAIGARQGAGDREPTVAAPYIEHQRRLPAEQRREIDDPFRNFLQRRFRPLCAVENLTGNRHAEFLFGPAGTGVIDG